MSIKKKKRMPKCRCYPHPAIPNEPDFSVVVKHKTNWRWGDVFLKCNICGTVAKNAISYKYAEKRQFHVAPEGWDRGVHPDFKERLEHWRHEQSQKRSAALESRIETRQTSQSRPRPDWIELPSGIILPTPEEVSEFGDRPQKSTEQMQQDFEDFNALVIRAEEMRKEGKTPEQIDAFFRENGVRYTRKTDKRSNHK